MQLSRRTLIKAALCSTLPVSLLSNISFASTPGTKRIVVIMLRGAMDGLHLLQPYGDKAFRKLRPKLTLSPDHNDLVVLDDFYGLYSPPKARDLNSLWQAGELSFIQSVSTPYRDGRSHFDGQDILETGGRHTGELREGWLTRMIHAIPGASLNDMMTLSQGSMLLGHGNPSIPNWWPGSILDGSTISIAQLQDLYKNDSAFRKAAKDIGGYKNFGTERITDEKNISTILARTASTVLKNEASIAAFSIGGWDTHLNQIKSMYWPVKALGKALFELKSGLGKHWTDTAVICLTEFGRSVHENGVGGTDHGTGGLAILSGGAIAGQNVYGMWPGLEEGSLLNQRDLMPTEDIRAYIGLLFHQMMGADISTIENMVFPGLSIGLKDNLI